MLPKPMVVSVFAGVRECTREGDDLCREVMESGAIKLGDKQMEPVDAAELFERALYSIQVKRYSETINDLNAALEAEPSLLEAYWS
ncbi:hypothetical protein L6452_30009 [Arctium lappa]|uniref:Uncharacterized protein n=1 Tax=Arctium lappa TaxID=4217 RepID=A0ACB8ZI06_ARCLA|nr:hypothetical protein L6452_30009 [Arctium lappa]